MTEEEWFGTQDVAAMLEVPVVASATRKWRLFGIACAWEFRPWFPDDILAVALDKAEMFAEGRLAGSTLDKWRQRIQRISRSLMKYDAHLMPPARAADAVIEMCRSSLTRVFYPYHFLKYPIHPHQGEDFVARSPLLPQKFIRDIFGNPFRPIALNPRWQTETVVSLAQGIYADKAFDRMPVLADALEEAGCDNMDILNHCRGEGPHVRGCWVVDLMLGKQ